MNASNETRNVPEPTEPDEGPLPEINLPSDDAVISRAFQISVMVLVVVGLCAVGLAYLVWRPPTLVEEQRGYGPDPQTRKKVEMAMIPPMPFADITAEAGIDFVHANGATGDKLLPESMGPGCAFFDYNNDGHPDILLVNSNWWPGEQPRDQTPPTMALYRNDGKGKFENVTKAAGLAISFYGQGAAVGDFDGDGWIDVFFTGVGGNRLYRNNQGKFEDVTESAGVGGSDTEWSTSCAWLDYDRDGDLDLFVCNYIRWTAEIDSSLGCSILGGSVRAYCRPDAFQGTYPYLYRNEGNGKFTDVSAQAGVQVNNRFTGKPAAKSLGVMPVDADGDGWIDMVIANDTVQNFLFHNQRDGTFLEVGDERGIAFGVDGAARGAMGVDAAWLWLQQGKDATGQETLAVAIGNFANEPTALFCSKGTDMFFKDDAVALGIGPQSRVWLKFGLFFYDADLDGRLDLLVANGHLENEINKVDQSQQYAQPPQVFWNTGMGTVTANFQPIPENKIGADFAKPLVGRGAAYADIDGDGDLDVLLTATGGPARLLRNDQALGHHWVRLRLVGKGANRDALGAVVTLYSGRSVQRRIVMPTRSYLSQVELPVTFGLGLSDKVDRILVRWPDGAEQDVERIEIDKLLKVEQK